MFHNVGDKLRRGLFYGFGDGFDNFVNNGRNRLTNLTFVDADGFRKTRFDVAAPNDRLFFRFFYRVGTADCDLYLFAGLLPNKKRVFEADK